MKEDNFARGMLLTLARIIIEIWVGFSKSKDITECLKLRNIVQTNKSFNSFSGQVQGAVDRPPI